MKESQEPLLPNEGSFSGPYNSISNVQAHVKQSSPPLGLAELEAEAKGIQRREVYNQPLNLIGWGLPKIA